MPRNRNKRPCQHPGCRNWAMRGREFCRVHLAHELGPLGGGAPARNLFGVKDAERATAVPEPGLAQIAGEIARDPERLAEQLAPVIRDLQVRAGDPVKALRALRKALGELIPQVIGEVVALEVGAVLDTLPASQWVSFRNAVIRQARSGDAESTLAFVRRWRGGLGHPGRGERREITDTGHPRAAHRDLVGATRRAGSTRSARGGGAVSGGVEVCSGRLG